MKRTVIGILAHVDAGKTTLSEALLYKSGVIRKQGRVDTKDAFLDNNVMERERGITIFSKEARINTQNSSIILIDTPGHTDFCAETERALCVLDAAVLVISASDMVTAHTKTLWKLLKLYRIPTFIFVNKMDLVEKDKDSIIATIKKELKVTAVNFEDDTEESFFEDIAATDEKLIEKYYETFNVSKEDIEESIRKMDVVPCLLGSALKLEGVDKLIEVIDKYAPDRKHFDEPSFYVYKVSRDLKNNRLSHIRCFGGNLHVKELLGEEKVNEIRLYNGENYETVPDVEAGDVFTVPGLTGTQTGTSFGKSIHTHSATMEPVISYTVFYDKSCDTNKMLQALKNLEEEEPGLKVIYDEEVKEIKLSLMGEIQKQIITRLLKDRFGYDVSFGQGKINYRETIAAPIEGVGHFEPLRHYAEAHIVIEPAPLGSGLSFDSMVSTDDLALNWQRLVLTHLKEKVHKGVLTGSPLTDVKFTLVAGKAHLKHTEGGDFRQATYRAVRQGLMMTQSVLLEPVYDFTLTVPSNLAGRAMTDMERLKSTCELTENDNETAVINGKGPVYTLNGYAADLMAYTKGLGTISFAFRGYEPCHNAEEVINAFGYNPEADLRNTPDSVFCMHGAGTTIKWDEVYKYMHLPLLTDDGDEGEEIYEPANKSLKSSLDEFVTVEQIDEIINRTSFANRKKVQVSSKGISAALKERRRVVKKAEAQEVTYREKKVVVKEKYTLIDGYNLVHAWPELKELASVNINAAADKLMDIASNYQGMTGENVLLVFDAYKVLNHNTEEFKYNNIRVVYTKTAETADRFIERYAHENASKYDITVVTSDGVEQIIIRGQGCKLLSSKDFISVYDNECRYLRESKGVL